MFRFRDEEPDECSQHEIYGGEEPEGVEAFALEEGREELLEDGVGHVLHLRGHADGLGADVHAEDLGGPDPGGSAPGGLVEEDEEEQQGDDGDSHGLGLGAAGEGGGLHADEGDDQHAHAHAQRADDQERLAAEPVDGPDRVQREEDAARGVERVDQRDLGCGREDFLVDGGGVGVERPLTGELLADVEHEGEQEATPDGRIFPQGGVGGADGFFFVLEGFDYGLEGR